MPGAICTTGGAGTNVGREGTGLGGGVAVACCTGAGFCVVVVAVVGRWVVFRAGEGLDGAGFVVVVAVVVAGVAGGVVVSAGGAAGVVDGVGCGAVVVGAAAGATAVGTFGLCLWHPASNASAHTADTVMKRRVILLFLA